MIHLGLISRVQYRNLHVRRLKNLHVRSLRNVPYRQIQDAAASHPCTCTYRAACTFSHRAHVLQPQRSPFLSVWVTPLTHPFCGTCGCSILTCTCAAPQWAHGHPWMTGLKLSQHPMAGQGRGPDVFRRFLAVHKKILKTGLCTSRSLPHKCYNLKFCTSSCHFYISFPAQSLLTSKVSI